MFCTYKADLIKFFSEVQGCIYRKQTKRGEKLCGSRSVFGLFFKILFIYFLLEHKRHSIAKPINIKSIKNNRINKIGGEDS